MSPDGETVNQVDHILIYSKFRSALTYARTYGEADVDSHHKMAVERYRVKPKEKHSRSLRSKRFDEEVLKDDRRKEY